MAKSRSRRPLEAPESSRWTIEAPAPGCVGLRLGGLGLLELVGRVDRLACPSDRELDAGAPDQPHDADRLLNEIDGDEEDGDTEEDDPEDRERCEQPVHLSTTSPMVKMTARTTAKAASAKTRLLVAGVAGAGVSGLPSSRDMSSSRASRRWIGGGGTGRRFVGRMKAALIWDTARRSVDGMRGIASAIFWSALISCSGAPVRRTAPRSAVYSRQREIVSMIPRPAA